MIDSVSSETLSKPGHSRLPALLSVVLFGLTGAGLLSSWLDAHRPPVDPGLEEEKLYVAGSTARRMSLSFNGLVADWYWMRSLQYVGQKLIDQPEGVEIDDLSQLNLKLLAPLLDTATTLDPEFIEPYEYAAIVLPAIDVKQAIKLARKGIEANPSSWRLYQQLGYIYWQQGDFPRASATYGEGAKLAGAPVWMEAMKARMAAEGGSRATAREIYQRIYEQSDDSKVKDMARRRLLQVDSLDQRDALRKILIAYREKIGHCPASWRDIDAVLRALHFPVDGSGAPLDPAGTPYILKSRECDVDLNPSSEVPYR
jgi:tetratricopeptide (TPR) repeat protein